MVYKQKATLFVAIRMSKKTIKRFVFILFRCKAQKKTFILFADVNKISTFGSQKHVLWRGSFTKKRNLLYFYRKR